MKKSALRFALAVSGGGGIANKAIHEWLIFGVRGVFDILLD